MGRPPSNGAPAFRFNPTEVVQMEAVLREHQGQVPARELLLALAEKFSNSPERVGKITVQMKQVWNWFQNRRYALRSKLVKSPGKLNISPMPRDEVAPVRNVPPVPQQISVPSGHNVVRSTSETPPMEFEAKSARDGAWYDVQAFFSHRYLETGNPEVLVRFAGFGSEEDEWVNVRKHVRQRSLPCEASECVAVLAGDLILCFQEGKEQALYFDAHVLDAQRRRHDIRGCRCRFLVRYDHDQSEEIVPLRKICRRPETDYRFQQLHAVKEAASASADPQKPLLDPSSSSNTFKLTPPISTMSSAASSSTLAPAPIPAPVPVSVSIPAPVPISVAVPAPVPVSVAAAPVPVPVSVPTPVPVPVSAPALVPVPVPISAPGPAPVHVSVPGPVPLPIPVSACGPVPGTVSTCGPVPVLTPDPVPEQKVESSNPGESVGEAATDANIINPGAEKIDASNPGQPDLSTENIKE